MYKVKQDLLKVNPCTRPGIKLNAVKGIVLHWTANENAGADDVAHQRYFNGNAIAAHSYASAHYFVDQDSILQIIPDNEMAYHCGARVYQTHKLGSYPNGCTIGIETCVNVKGAGFKKALDQSAQLAASLLKKHKLTVNDMYRHFDVTGKDCPRYFVSNTTAKEYGLGDNAYKAWEEFKKLVASYLVPVKKPAPAPSKAPVKATKKKQYVEVIFSQPIAVRASADFDKPAISSAKKGSVFTVKRLVKSKQGQQMVETISGLFITAHPKYVKVYKK